ncbi:MAG TPA: hypothetical protein VK482_00400, partial [Buchnera sp. (in: enterobacteria)]|nr:hypothetical protein [Buchnera sp. (in: enterobacteria)]
GLQVKNGIYKFFVNAKQGDQPVNCSPLTYDNVQSVLTSSEKDTVINVKNFTKEIALKHIRKIF